MKILLIANIFPPIVGGSAGVYHAYCKHLGDRVAVLTPWRSYITGEPIARWQETDSQQPFRVVRLELLRPKLRPNSRSVIKAVWDQIARDTLLRQRIRRGVWKVANEFRPDVVCLGELHALSWLGQEFQAKGVPVIQFIHGEEVTTNCASRQFRLEARRALRSVTGIVAVSAFTRRCLIELGVDETIIHLIPNGVDGVRFSPGPKSDIILRRHGLNGKKILLTVARFEERKGHDNVIRAMPQILLAIPDAIYLVAGARDAGQCRLMHLVRELGLEDKVIFAGAISEDEMCDYYRSCDVFIMPNRALPGGDTEGFGLVFLEASACLKPVIGGRAGGVVDAVIDRETGLLIDGASVSAIAGAAIHLLSDCAYAERLAAAGFRRAKEFDWELKAKQFLSLCEAAASRNKLYANDRQS
jgi:phosphatidyl-myo-inositol dimannoside synthase